MSFLLTDSTRPTEFFLGFTLFLWGLWLVGPAEGYVVLQTGVTTYLSWILPLGGWGVALLSIGGGQCLSVMRTHWTRSFFSAVQLLFWIFFFTLFLLARFYTMSFIVCPVYVLVSAWVFLRLLFDIEEGGESA